MQKTGEDNEYTYFLDDFQSEPMQVLQDKKTGEILFNADEVVKVLGLGGSLIEFLSTDKGLDFLNQFKHSHGNCDLFGERGMIRRMGKDQNYKE